MLQWLRKHQKYFFIFLAIIIIISFSFFGTYSALMTSDEVEESGPILKKDLSAMTALLARDEFFTTDLVDTGFLGQVALAHWWDGVCADLGPRFERQGAWKPFVHPENSSISAMNVWQKAAPEIPQALEIFQSSKDVGERVAAHMALFSMQQKFSPELLGFVLGRQAIDAECGVHCTAAPAIFGYRDVYDWMGPHLMEEAAKAVFRLAEKAEALAVVSRETEPARRALDLAKKLLAKAEEAVVVDDALFADQMAERIECSVRLPSEEALYAYESYQPLRVKSARVRMKEVTLAEAKEQIPLRAVLEAKMDRDEMVRTNPVWLAKALDRAESKWVDLRAYMLKGLKNKVEFTWKPQEVSFDNNTYYRIEEVGEVTAYTVPFEEAYAAGLIPQQKLEVARKKYSGVIRDTLKAAADAGLPWKPQLKCSKEQYAAKMRFVGQLGSNSSLLRRKTVELVEGQTIGKAGLDDQLYPYLMVATARGGACAKKEALIRALKAEAKLQVLQ